MKHNGKITEFFTQKILPLVYDDSLSYYEVVNKIVYRINEIIEYINDLKKYTFEEIGNTVEQLNLSIEGVKNELNSLKNNLLNKVDKEYGKGLSSNDFTNSDKEKLNAIPSDAKYTDTIYDDTEIREEIEDLDEFKMERYVIRLVKNSDNTFKLTSLDGDELTFTEVYNVTRKLNEYVVIIYGSSKLRPQYVSTNEIMFIGLDRSNESKILRILYTPNRLTYETFKLTEWTEFQNVLNVERAKWDNIQVTKINFTKYVLPNNTWTNVADFSVPNGMYIVLVHIGFAKASSGDYGFNIRTTARQSNIYCSGKLCNLNYTVCTYSTVLNVTNASDTYYLNAIQTSGGNLNVGSDTQSNTIFGVELFKIK